MTKIIIFLILFVAFISFFYFQFNQIEESFGFQINYIGDDLETEGVEVYKNGETIFFISIDELNGWMIDNWDNFEEEPEVGGRKVEPGNFGFFDQTASISENNKKLFFTVHDYAVLTTLTFIMVADIETGDLKTIEAPVRGNPENLLWSGSDFLVSTFGTARSEGDLLYLFDFLNYKKVFSVSGDDLLINFPEIYSIDELTEFMPRFRELSWEGDYVFFKTDNPADLDDYLNWKIDKNGQNLEILN